MNQLKYIATGLAYGCMLLGCSKSDETTDPVGMAGAPAGGSPAAMAGAAGTAGTGGATAGMSNGGSAGAGACAEACSGGKSCKMGVCTCPSNKVDECNAMCVNLQDDPDNCGVCGTVCDPGAACSAGVCSTAPTDLATLAACGTMRMILAGTTFYLTDKEAGKILSVPLAGGAATEVAMGQAMPFAIAASATTLYWANEGDNTIMQMPLAGPTATVLHTADAPVRGLALNGDLLFFTSGANVYKLDTAGVGDAGTASYVSSSDESGSPMGFPAGISADATRVVWATDSRQAVETDLQEYMEFPEGGIMSPGYFELGESQGTLLVTDTHLTATHGYWAAGDKIVRAIIDMDKVAETITTTLDFAPVTGFVINDTTVYFGSSMAETPGFVYKAPLMKESDATKIARDQLHPSSFVINGTSVYYLTSGTDCVIRSVPVQ